MTRYLPQELSTLCFENLELIYLLVLAHELQNLLVSSSLGLELELCPYT